MDFCFHVGHFDILELKRGVSSLSYISFFHLTGSMLLLVSFLFSFLFLSFYFSIFDVRSYVSYEDFYMGRFKDYREGVGFFGFVSFLYFGAG